MSYTKARQRTEATPTEQKDTTRCPAYGCKCPASVNSGGSGWLCRYHVEALPDTWQTVTRRLSENDWLLGFIGDVQKMANACQPWREFSERFWEFDAEGKPAEFEDASAYVYRLNREMLWRCGQQKTRPVPIDPKDKLAKFLKGARLVKLTEKG